MDYAPSDHEMARYYAKQSMITQNETNEKLRAALRRVCDSLATFIRESSDPGTEALVALHEAQRLL